MYSSNSNNKLTFSLVGFLIVVSFCFSLIKSTKFLKSSSSNNNRKLEVIGDKILKRTYGTGWNVWDKQTIIKGVYLRCSWTYYRSGGKSLPMCVHPGNETVSRSINDIGFWNECREVSQLWLDASNYINDESVFLDIGANIGSCTMHLLLNTNAKIIAFEPDPRNLFCLTSTLAGLDKEYQDRVTLFPIGLGSDASHSFILGTKHNLGHSVISLLKHAHINPVNQYEPEQVHIERLDSILDSKEFNVPVVKIDAEGFECNVVDGMGSILTDSIHTIHTEVFHGELQRFSCGIGKYFEKLQAANFHVSKLNGFTYIATNQEH